jgi:S1-C subfamily serine protease
MGHPFGLSGSVTAGIVSARNRDIRSGPYDSFIQADAPINQGNSGGPRVTRVMQGSPGDQTGPQPGGEGNSRRYGGRAYRRVAGAS